MKNLHSAACCFHNLLWHSYSIGNSEIIASRFALCGRYYSHASWESAYPNIRLDAYQHPFKNWHQLRKHKLTASTFSSAIGFWPRRRVQLWLEKIGAKEPFYGNWPTYWNNTKEEKALEQYKKLSGFSVSYLEFQVYKEMNPEDDWLAASPDGLVNGVLNGRPSRGVLEIKCPLFNWDKSQSIPWRRIPIHYIPQAQGLMEILDLDWMDMYVWTIRGYSLFRLYRDREYWDLLRIALSDFWWKHVHPARELSQNKEISDPFSQLSSFVPAPRHNLHRDLVYKSRLISDRSELLVREIDGEKLKVRL